MSHKCESENPDTCTYHYTLAVKQKLDLAKALHRKAKGRSALLEAQKDLTRVTRMYHSTPEGMRKLKEQIAKEKLTNPFPIQLEEKLRIAKADYNKRKVENSIDSFIHKPISPETITSLFIKTKYSLTKLKPNYFELREIGKDITTPNVIATVKKIKKSFLITTKNSLLEPTDSAFTFGSTDTIVGDIQAVKLALVNLRREIMRNDNRYDHSKHILSDTRKYRLLVTTHTIIFNKFPQKHYIIYSSKGIPFAVYRVDNNGTFVEGYGALGREKVEPLNNAWDFREWVNNYRDTERSLPENFLSRSPQS